MWFHFDGAILGGGHCHRRYEFARLGPSFVHRFSQTLVNHHAARLGPFFISGLQGRYIFPVQMHFAETFIVNTENCSRRD